MSPRGGGGGGGGEGVTQTKIDIITNIARIQHRLISKHAQCIHVLIVSQNMITNDLFGKKTKKKNRYISYVYEEAGGGAGGGGGGVTDISKIQKAHNVY